MVMKVALNSFRAKPYSSFASYKAHHSSAPPPSSFPQIGGGSRIPGSACWLGRRSPPLTFCVSRNHYPSSSERFLDRRLPERCRDFDSAIALDRYGYEGEGHSNNQNVSGLPCPRLQFLCPPVLGIRPSPPEWPERGELSRISIEQKANRPADIPLSIKIIKMKQRQIRMGLALVDKAMEGTDTDCSMKRAFSSMTLIFRELQRYAVHMERGSGGEGLNEIVGKVQSEINDSFLWLFRQVFSQTPTLMVDVMILLANFGVYSMVGNSGIAAPAISQLETITEDESQDDHQREDLPVMTFGDEHSVLRGEEEVLWSTIMEEVRKMKGELLDEETVPGFVAPVNVNVNREEIEEHLRTDLLYQMNLSQDPENPLLLCNYAQFLTNISHDYDRAEECFKRAMQLEQADAEALSQYADFLYMVRKDMWGAEERYQQAIAMEPNNSFYSSKYASFLWNTGGEETCYPLELPDNESSKMKLSSNEEYS